MKFRNRAWPMRAVCLFALGTIALLFQNCSNGFEVLSSATSAPSLQAIAGSPPPPGLLAPLTPKTFYVGDTLFLQPMVQMTEGSEYQWSKDGIEIPGATAASLTIANAAGKDAGAYVLQIRDGNKTVQSPAIPVTIKAAVGPKVPEGIVASSSDTIIEGQDLTIVVDAKGSPTPNYSWALLNAIADVTIDQSTDSLVLKGLRPYIPKGLKTVYPFTAKIKLTLQNVNESKEIILTYKLLEPIPKFIYSLQAKTASAGDVVNLCADAGPAAKYTWTKDGAPISNNVLCLLLYPVAKSDAGSYKVTATTATGSTSSEAVLTVTDAPVITKLTDQVISMGAPFVNDICTWNTSWEVAYQGKVTLSSTNVNSYKWSKDGVVLPMHTTSCLYGLNRFQLADSGRYTVEVTNSKGTSSESAKITVLPAGQVIITKPLKDATLLPDDVPNSDAPLASPLCVGVVGANRFQWSHNGVILPLANRPCLNVFSPGSRASNGVYTVTASFDPGSGVVASLQSSATFDFTKMARPPSFPLQLGDALTVAGDWRKIVASGLSETLLSTSSFSWFKDGKPAPFGQNSTSYDISSPTVADSGRYEVRARTPNGELYTAFGNILVLPETTPPYTARREARLSSDVSWAEVNAAGTISNCVTVLGKDLRYEWRKDGVVQPDQVDYCYKLPVLFTPELRGVYELTASNQYGSKSYSFTIP